MNTALVIIFIIGYFFIAIEHSVGINKAAAALLTAVIMWVIYILNSSETSSQHHIAEQLTENLGEVSGILFFLLGAMTIVELIDVHDGFDIVTKLIKTKSVLKLAWIISIITFFLSAALDNLTTAIVMTSMVKKIVPQSDTRLKYIGLIVISANAGGAWSPIGDVTTTMLWIGGQLTAGSVITTLIIPSLVCLIVPLLLISSSLKGELTSNTANETIYTPSLRKERNIIFYSGIGVLLFVPFFKTITHLPPFMGILFGVGLLWIITSIIHKKKNDKEKSVYSVSHALEKIDTSSILFFLGILLSISVLQNTGVLNQLAQSLNNTLGNEKLIGVVLGLVSSVVDNVPLVAASMGMYTLEQYPIDHSFWHLLAYTTGTGGSALIIGSAAGVAVMGMENITFMWYVKKISWLALAGFAAGALVLLLFN
ncbi:MAG: sodium:proton antiporter NhaD [Bacteroidota bacterium]|nr:sodium:proton antiporter NhaD [Bacteroidota bacterium]